MTCLESDLEDVLYITSQEAMLREASCRYGNLIATSGAAYAMR